MMKRLIIVILLIAIPAINFAQNNSLTKSKPVYVSSFEPDENSVEIFIEVEAEEFYKKDLLNVSIKTGELYQQYVSGKNDIKLMEEIRSNAEKITNIPDLLTYLSNEGFMVVHFSAFTMENSILNKIILNRIFVKNKKLR